MKKLVNITLADRDAERVRRNHQEVIAEMQAAPMVAARLVVDVDLVDGVLTQVSHGLGRKPFAVLLSPVRNATGVGRIEEVRDGTVDRTRYVGLKATGYASTITLDVMAL